MADIFDRASDLEELQRQQAIKDHLQGVADRRLQVTGCCHNCREPLADGQLFCDADCRGDHEKRARLRG